MKHLPTKTCCSPMLLTLLFFLMSSPAIAQVADVSADTPSLQIRRSTGEIKVDGRLDDPGWKGAAVADSFYETYPGDNITPPVDTKAYVTFDDDNLYVAIVAYADPQKVRGSLCQRDRTPGDDNVGFILDTYGDADWGYVFFINRHGVQYDALSTNSGGWDTRYDLIWESSGQLTDSGFQVEVAVPFSSLRFPAQPVQNWKMDFVRYHEREVTYYLTWCPSDLNEPCELCQIADVSGIENVKPGKGIEIIPALTAFQFGELDSDSRGNLFFDNSDLDGDVSLSAKYAISSNSTAEIAVNPDFSQVEADANQIDINSTTALSFPEKRPFFQEGSDLFNTDYDVVYTRSINDPIFAAKATARLGRFSIAYLGAYDEHSPVIIPFEEFSSSEIDLGRSMSNILRLRQSFGENSRIGILATDRQYDGGGSGSAFSLDGEVRLAQSVALNCQIVATRTVEPDDTLLTDDLYRYSWIDDSLVTTSATEYLFDDHHTAAFDAESFWGHAYSAELTYSPRDFSAGIEFWALSPTFRLDNGYQPDNSRREVALDASYRIRFADGLLESIQPLFSATQTWNTDGSIKNKSVVLGVSTSFRWSQANYHPSYIKSSEYFAGKQFDNIWTIHQCFSMAPGKHVAFGGGTNYGNAIARRARLIGRQTLSWLWLDLQPVDQLFIENSFDWISSKDVVTDELIYEGFWGRTSMNYQFNRELSVRCMVQYDDSRETWDIDPLLTYRVNPFTLFYIGTTFDYRRMGELNHDGTALAAANEQAYSHNKLTTRQFFVKLQYLFQQ